MSNSYDLSTARRENIARRLLDVQKRYGLPELDRVRLDRLTTAVAGTLGEDGVPDTDLRVLSKLTSRGLLDNFD